MDYPQWAGLSDETIVNDTAKNIEERNIKVEILENKEDALRRLQELIPEGASVMSGGSTTLDEIGFTDLLKAGNHPWRNLKEKIILEKDPERQMKLRRESTLADYYLGSVHAISRAGEVVVASATGSQLPSYVFSSPNVIWVVGTQKITDDIGMAMRRVKEYVLPLEDERMKKEGFEGSFIGKLMILRREAVPERITMLLVKEKLGF